jgi:hypothetical protein
VHLLHLSAARSFPHFIIIVIIFHTWRYYLTQKQNKPPPAEPAVKTKNVKIRKSRLPKASSVSALGLTQSASRPSSGDTGELFL